MLRRTKDRRKSCQLAANETSLWGYPNPQRVNVYNPPLYCFNPWLPNLPLHPAFCEAARAPLRPSVWLFTHGHSPGALNEEKSATCMENVKMLNWYMSEHLLFLILGFILYFYDIKTASTMLTHKNTLTLSSVSLKMVKMSM